MLTRRNVACDIETLATPENSGYDIVIPNYALVVVPDDPRSYLLDWIYVQLPVQPQIEKGLKIDAPAMSFWFNDCAQEKPRALEEMKKSLDLKQAQIRINNRQHKGYSAHPSSDPSCVIENFITNYGSEDGKIWGNGCHFDCSILQANHRLMYHNSTMWHYSAPQNARSIKDLLSEDERTEMDSIVTDYLGRFETTTRVECGLTNLELHHPLYDAAREALQISYCLQKKKG